MLRFSPPYQKMSATLQNIFRINNILCETGSWNTKDEMNMGADIGGTLYSVFTCIPFIFQITYR